MKNAFNLNANWKKVAATALAALGLVGGLTGCNNPAAVASRNLSEAADNFEIDRRIVFYNVIADKYMLVVEGKCSIEVDAAKNKLDVTCRTGPNEYKKHFLGRADNVTFFAEQIAAAPVNTYNYRVSFNPQELIPDIRVRGSAAALQQAVTPGARP